MTSYEVIWIRTIEAADPVEAADKALDQIRAELPEKGVTTFEVDGREIDPWNPPLCSVQIFAGSRIDPPEMCDGVVTHWDEHGEGYCIRHSAQPDPFDGRDI